MISLERGPPFNTEMTRGVMDGTKTQTRRVIKEWPPKIKVIRRIRGISGLIGQPGIYQPYSNKHGALSIKTDGKMLGVKPSEFEWISPYGKPGDSLYVREALTRFNREPHPTAQYVVDATGVPYAQGSKGKAFGGQAIWQWKNKTLPSLFMPRWAARTFLRIKDIRVERVQDITSEDILLEGTPIPVSSNNNILFELATKPFSLSYYVDNLPDKWTEDEYLKAYWGHLWDSINYKRGYGWKINPRVWVIVFEKISNG